MAWWDDSLVGSLTTDQLEGFVTVEEAAAQMGMTETRVRQLVQDRVLRSAYTGLAMLVQPAITNRTRDLVAAAVSSPAAATTTPRAGQDSLSV